MMGGSKTPIEERDEASTPDWLFRWLSERWPFDVDLAASVSNHKLDLYLTKDNDALTCNWVNLGSVGFVNPPYSNIGPWFKKAAAEALRGFTSVFVVPTPNGESHYKIVELSASEIILIHGRVAFRRPDGTYMSANPRGTCIVVFSPGGGPAKLSWVDRDRIKKGDRA